MVQLIWSEPAQLDMEEIFRFNNALSPKMAIACAEELIKAGDRLKQMPEMGPVEPTFEHLKRNYRYVLVLRRYKLVYLYENGVCSILMVWDCRRNPEQLKGSPRFEP